jgi:hypothetical protein
MGELERGIAAPGGSQAAKIVAIEITIRHPVSAATPSLLSRQAAFPTARDLRGDALCRIAPIC